MKLAVVLILILGITAGCTQVTQEQVFQDTIAEDHSGLVSEEVGLQVGFLPPDFEYEQGKTIRQLDKPVIIYFMATWCPFCKNDFNALKEVYAEYDDKVMIIAQSLDLKETQTQLDNYKKQFPGLENMLLLEGKESVLKDYNVRYTTTKYAIGADGRIIYAGSGELTTDQWVVLLKALAESKA